jgi:hypothetical protein
MYAMFFPLWVMNMSLQMMAFNMSIAAAGTAPLRIGRSRSRAQLSVVAYNRNVLSVRSRAMLSVVA